jgi:thioredoxin-like negative regulator of GroEL
MMELPDQYYQAMNEWRSVLGQDPGNLEARLGLARAAAKAGDRAPAAQEYFPILPKTLRRGETCRRRLSATLA